MIVYPLLGYLILLSNGGLIKKESINAVCLSFEQLEISGLEGLFTISVDLDFKVRLFESLFLFIVVPASIQDRFGLLDLVDSLFHLHLLSFFLLAGFNIFDKVSFSFGFPHNLASLNRTGFESTNNQGRLYLLLNFFSFGQNVLNNFFFCDLLKLFWQFIDINIILEPLIKFESGVSLISFRYLKEQSPFISFEQLFVEFLFIA